jgi:2-methylaconitate cis-trans-isomerase PrpF
MLLLNTHSNPERSNSDLAVPMLAVDTATIGNTGTHSNPARSNSDVVVPVLAVEAAAVGNTGTRYW